MPRANSFLCLTCDFKGEAFFRALKADGNKVYLVTSTENKDKAWPFEVLDDIFYIDKQKDGHWNTDHLLSGVAHLMRTHKIDRVVALDDFDVQKGAMIREHFRIPGMGQTTANVFRDKLAMRTNAKECGINVPGFSALFNDTEVNDFINNSSAPWMVKPRSEASANGIKKVNSPDELWNVIHKLGEHRDKYLVEEFKPGHVYHADSLIVKGKVKFCRVSKYVNTPLEVAHGGGVFQTATLPFGSKEDKAIQEMNANIMKQFGMIDGASHTEFIQCKEDGEFYFLETSARVGGAHIAEMVEASSDINLWEEWAKLESANAQNKAYKLPKVSKKHAGIVVSLSRFEYPDTSCFNDKEICWRLDKKNHIGLVVRADKQARVQTLLQQYTQKIAQDFHASAPAKKVYHGEH